MGSPSLPLRILIAEDDRVNRLVTLKMLQRLNVEADAVASGREALEAVQRVAYDLVLMDVQMPGMDGLATTAAIRAHERNTSHRSCILALTAHALLGDRERFIAAGMDGYLSKPLKANELEAALSEVKRRRHERSEA